ncbi:MAG TPA: helix-turn-helix domain-containing protein [Bacteroidia bacterium]
MALSFLTNLNEEEFKVFLKEALCDIIGDGLTQTKSNIPEILDVKQAAEFLRLKITTLYEKTSEKTIPHFKKGNKLYFNRDELQAWVQEGKVKTNSELQGEAASYTMHKQRK